MATKERPADLRLVERAPRPSAFVTSERWVIWELPDGTIGEGAEEAFRGLRDSTPEEDRDQISAIWTPAEMGAMKRAAVMDATIRLGRSMQDLGDGEGAMASAGLDMAFHQGAYQMALLRHNILRWQGAKFQDDNGGPIQLTQANIDRLNAHDPLIQRALQSIGRRNPLNGRASPDPKSPAGAATSSSAGGSSSTAS